MPDRYPLPDADARLTAETTFDRNVVVLAGAGTGKTTLLINRVIHALLREPDPLQVTELLTLTFTNKAANELKVRLRDRLRGLVAELQGGHSSDQELEVFQQTYHLSLDHMRDKVQAALDDLEKAQIATLHSFAAHVLRLYPLESEVDPNFQEDEGHQFSEMFHQAWEGWMEQEFDTSGTAHAQWQDVLMHVSLHDIREFACSLCQDQVSLAELDKQVRSDAVPPAFRSWLLDKQQQVRMLLKRYDREKPRKVEKLLMIASQVLENSGPEATSSHAGLAESELTFFGTPLGKAPGDWDAADFQTAHLAIQAARRLLKVNHGVLGTLIRLLSPFAEHVRQNMAEKGWIQFDGLLIRVRNLLRDHPMIREQLKTTYKAILVDEFQDTDPVQYEILLYLGERPGGQGRVWRDVRLMPGKLFIVGDPKQSIYAFRRADIEAFDQVVKKIMEEGGVVCTLLTNFRSDRKILEVVNAVFDRLFIPQVNVQPPNVPLAPGRTREDGSTVTGVELCVMSPGDETDEWDAERATRVEAEWLAGWIAEELRQEKPVMVEKGMTTPLRPGHIAVLFRKFTNAQVYLEALQRQGIPCMTDGERHFYRRQEIIDVVNVLRVMDDPGDAIALVGILRSSLGGLSDQEIMELAQTAPWDVRQFHLLNTWEHAHASAIQDLYRRLTLLHAQAERLPIPEVLDQMFQHLPIEELAAASGHGEQAVANVRKLRDLMNEQAHMPHLSFSAWVDRLADSLMTHPPEPEAPLAEDTVEAVRVLTIHKAKGLEFPMVIIPGLHQHALLTERGAGITFDWISGLYGCTIPSIWNASQVPLWEKQRIREDAEQRRVLYVGMTRARERLILSGGILARGGGGSLLNLLQQIATEKFGHSNEKSVTLGEVGIPQTVVTSKDRTRKPNTPLPSVPSTGETSDVAASPQWAKREARWHRTIKAVAYQKPSLLHQQRQEPEWSTAHSSGVANGQRLGTLMHRLLQHWDFHGEATAWRKHLADFCRQQLLCERTHDRAGLAGELETLLEGFLRSPAYQELQRATILGREVAFAVPWTNHDGEGVPPQSCVLEGVMDIIYEIDHDVWVGDYKTDRISSVMIDQRAQLYREQALAYAYAASRSLGMRVKGCKLFFLRPGEVVSVTLPEDLH